MGGLINLKSFGSSLSNGLDVDGNGYPGVCVCGVYIFSFLLQILLWELTCRSKYFC